MTCGHRIGCAVLAVGVLGGAVFAGAGSGTAAGATTQVDPVFDPEDAQELTEVLASATAAQDVCYGWTVQVDDGDTGSRTQSTGSNFGLGRSLTSAGVSCRYRVEFTADIWYVSSSSDSEDSGRWSVISIPGDGPDTGDLNRLELFDQGDLIGEDPDIAVTRAVTALPQLAAQAGIAPPLIAEPASSIPPDVGSLADDPGADYLRRAGGLLAVGAVLLVGGVAFGVFALRSSRSRTDPTPPKAPPAPPKGPSTPPR